MPNVVGSNRREFIREAALVVAVLSGCGGDSTGPTAIDGVTISGSQVTVDLTKVTALSSVGTALFIPGARVVVLRTASATFKAFTTTCTHAGCSVDSFAGGRINCPCHGSQYDTNGQVVAGPAPRALTEYATTFDAGSNVVTINKG
ncbi:MAG: Rieske (2Fe-2S) protein [Gemmatimonadaceae bacterium]